MAASQRVGVVDEQLDATLQREELQGLKMSELRARAQALGATEAELDVVEEDEESPREALIDLILARSATA